MKMRLGKAAIYLLGSMLCFSALFFKMPFPLTFVVFAGGVGLGMATVCQGIIAMFRLDTLKGRGVAHAVIGLASSPLPSLSQSSGGKFLWASGMTGTDLAKTFTIL